MGIDRSSGRRVDEIECWSLTRRGTVKNWVEETGSEGTLGKS